MPTETERAVHHGFKISNNYFFTFLSYENKNTILWSEESKDQKGSHLFWYHDDDTKRAGDWKSHLENWWQDGDKILFTRLQLSLGHTGMFALKRWVAIQSYWVRVFVEFFPVFPTSLFGQVPSRKEECGFISTFLCIQEQMAEIQIQIGQIVFIGS